MRARGETLRAIGKELGVSAERVRGMLLQAAHYPEWLKEPRPRGRSYLARIRDPDPENQRNVWLTYFPSVDPRLNNFKPVTTADFRR